MKALTWQGNENVAGHRRARSADRGADRRDHQGHLDGDLRLGPAPVRGARPVPQARRRARARGDGRRRGGRRRTSPTSPPGDRVVVPFNISCGSCWMCERGLFAQCETTQVRERGQGRGAVRLHLAVRLGARRAGRVPAGAAGALRPDQGAATGTPDEQFLFLSDILPTAWQAVRYADVPPGGTVAVLGLGPVGQFAVRIAAHLGAGRVIGVDRVPERLALAAAARRRAGRPRRRRRCRRQP